MNILEQLKTMTTIVADTGDLDAIRRLKPVDATTNPSLITKALSDASYTAKLKEAVVMHDGIDNAIDALTVQIGCEILKLISGRVSTEVDAKLSYDTDATVSKALRFIESYNKADIETSRILIKIAATWQGIKAAEVLEKQGIHCNLTLLFGMHQAKACADAGVQLISPFVGRILDWQKRAENVESISPEHDLGVRSVKDIYHYYKQHDYSTEIMGASFRSTEQICALAGCDLLTISPDLLDQLAQKTGTLERALGGTQDGNGENSTMARQPNLTKQQFANEHQQSAMATELLDKGIQGFVDARQTLSTMLQGLQ